ncbi:hypothetical protein MPLA_1390178 [Mesorhizobium sp. ORS 3359]|nr:hypothetical protein MPLA_1390178 [Mesorhizobium sp. ORS 3359]
MGRSGEGAEDGEEGAPGRALCRAGRADDHGPSDDGRDAGRRRDHWRGHVPRQYRHEGLSEEPEGDRRGFRRRLVPFRRPRRHAPRRLHPAQGPLQGYHHLGRREHLLHRGRGRALQASVGRLLRCGRPRGREMGRGAGRLCRAEARQDRDRSRDHRALSGAAGPLQGAEGSGVRGDSEDLDGQDPEVPAKGNGEGGVGRRGEESHVGRTEGGAKDRYLEISILVAARCPSQLSPSVTKSYAYVDFALTPRCFRFTTDEN